MSLQKILTTVAWFAFSGTLVQLDAQLACEEKVTPQIRIDPGHPWRPPFGLDRVGKALTAIVEITADERPMREYYLAALRSGREVERHVLNITRVKPPFTDTVTLDSYPDEIALSAKCRFEGEAVELMRYPVKLPALEADAIARPEKVINPVDLGAILVPADWLLLAAGQKAIVGVAAISYHQALPGALVRTWFESSKRTVERRLDLGERVRASIELETAPMVAGPERDVLHVVIVNGEGRELWGKEIRTMFVPHPPQLPTFGAVETKLRYDAPISVRDARSGAPSRMDYNGAWDPKLNDVVVTLPNGSRFVFWRGSSYIPFWAGLHNTGFCYEWAETTPPPDGFVDSVEPLMDKELRYGRVQIVESTTSRVHVRWTYQSTDFLYKVWGDEAVEDFYFYPDGFGTRVLTLKTAPGADYELSEFIVLTPQSAYPLEVLPKNMAEFIFMDGSRQDVSFPFRGKPSADAGFFANKLENPRKVPIVYRVHAHKDDPASGIYFYPRDLTTPIAYAPFYDRGYLVTPAYWGSHWPLGRGKSTGWSIDDRIYSNPGHNSLMTWGLGNRPTPISTSEIETIDTLGKSKPMTIQRWAWLIAMSDGSDERLIEWAQSFSEPPSVELKGAKLDFNAYVPERRAIRIQLEGPVATVTLKPVSRCVNPVLEVVGSPGKLVSIAMDDRPVPRSDYAWDGHTLWINATIDKPSRLALRFE